MKPITEWQCERRKNIETFFLEGQLDSATSEHYTELAALSHKHQADREHGDALSFDQFLSDYWQSSQID